MGELTLLKSVSGDDCALYDDIRLNSSYNPAEEAKRWVRREITEPPATVVMVGCTLGYEIEAARAACPYAKLIPVFFDSHLYTYSRNKLGSRFPVGFCPSPDRPAAFGEFLNQNLRETDLQGLVVLEWGPSVKIFKDLAETVRQALSQRIRELNGSIMATRVFGRRWIKNTFRGFYHLQRCLEPVKTSGALAVIGSGPSLTSSLDFIKAHRNHLFILALTSSLKTLLSAGVMPDAAVATDPGYWASRLAVTLEGTGIPLFIPLSAGIPPRIFSSSPIALIHQGTFYEEALLQGTSLPFIPIPSGGTVAATALQLGTTLAGGPLFAAGFDFCYQDILIHSRPHAFDMLDEISCGRTQPLLSLFWRRAVDTAAETLPGGSRRNLPFKTYAGWFARRRADGRPPVYRLHSSEVAVPGLIPTGESEAAAILHTHGTCRPAWEDISRPAAVSRAERAAKAHSVLTCWLKDLDSALAEAHGKGSRLPGDPAIHNLCYTLAVEDILHIKRLQHLGEHEKIAPVLETMLAKVRLFIKELNQPYEPG